MTFVSILIISIQKKTACSASSPFPLTQPAVSLYTGIPPKLFNLYLQNSSPITHAFNWVGVQSNQLKTWRNLSPPLTPDVCTSTRVVNIFNTPRSIACQWWPLEDCMECDQLELSKPRFGVHGRSWTPCWRSPEIIEISYKSDKSTILYYKYIMSRLKSYLKI